MWIVRLALQRPFTFVAVALLVLILGVVSILRMPADILPVVDIPIVSVIWQYDGLSAQEMERRVVTPAERTFTTTVNDIEHQESQSLNGLAVQRIYFQPGTSVESAQAQIEASAQSLLRRLPSGITAPLIVRYSASNVPILQINVSSASLPEEQLFDYATNFIRTPLTKVKGSQLPLPYGGKPRSVLVDLNPEALYAYGIAPTEVSNAINAQNLVLPGGTAKIGSVEYNVVLNSSPAMVDALNDIPIRAINGKMVFVRDVAQVRDGYNVQRNIVRSNGRRSVLLTVLKNGGASTLSVINGIKDAIPGVRSQIPSEVKIETLFDQSLFVRESIKGVVIEGGIAACLTALMILLFLGSWRSTLIVAISIPLSILVSLIVLAVLGQTINIMTLGGLALAVGILVDDTTVEIENIHRNLALGKPIRKAILDGAQEIAQPAFVATTAICIVFLPVFLITGPARSLFVPLALAVVFAMMASYLISRTLVPTMVMYLVRDEAELHLPKDSKEYEKAKKRREDDQKNKKKGKGEVKDPEEGKLWRIHQAFDKRFEALRDRYTGNLGWALRHPTAIFVTFGVIVAVSACLFPFLGRDFFPKVDAGEIRLHVRTPTGTRIEDTEAAFAEVETEVRKIIPASDLRLMLDNIGLAFGGVNFAFTNTSTVGLSDGEILIALNEGHKGATDDYVRQLREKLPRKFPNRTFYFENADIVGQILNFGLPAPLDIQVTGPPTTTEENLKVARQIEQRVKSIPGAVDVRLQQQTDAKDLRVSVDRIRAAQSGLTERDVANSLLISLSGSGQTAPNFFLDPRTGITYSIAVQTPQYRVSTIDSLLNTPILSAEAASTAGSSGASLARTGSQAQLLRNFATISRADSIANINHYDANPTYDINASVEGRDLGTVAAAVTKATEKIKLPRGSRVMIRGQAESMNSSFLGLGIGLIFAVVLVYFLMVVNFQSWVDPLIVILGLPGALAGMMWMLFAAQTTLSVPALMGAIMGIGVATANSILVVVFANEQRGLGKNAFEAALEAGHTRLRPVLMTAFAMMLGMLPMALGLSEGGEQNAPLGRAVIGGLLFATMTTLFVVPTLYSVLRRSEATGTFEVEEREQAEYERDNDLPFDQSLPAAILDEVKADKNKKHEKRDENEKNEKHDNKENQAKRNGKDPDSHPPSPSLASERGGV
jgi:multidrug efflux pump subunit AcrB